MAQFPALPLFTDAYLADTRHLSAEQHGAYLLLLMEAWRRPACTLPDDDEMLARLACMSGERWALNRETVMAFWAYDGRRKEWSQLRLTDERNYVRQKSLSQRHKAAKRWKTEGKDDAVAMPEGMPDACPLPTPTVGEDTNVSSLSEPAVADLARSKPGRRKANAYTPEYEAFWQAFPSTEGQSKLNGFKAWQQLTNAEQAQAVASLPAYAALLKREEGRKVKHVQGYLNGRMFETLGGATISELETPAQWLKRLGHARVKREWFPAKWGPAPGVEGCRVPPDLILPGDGENWTEARAA
jgi:uncharacterized protein YdaU (DUF1376 family)